jgi:hypothetical protein
VQVVGDGAALDPGVTGDEAVFRNQPALALAIGEDVEALLEHAVEEPRAPAAAIEDDGHLPITDGRAHLAQQFGEGFGE